MEGGQCRGLVEDLVGILTLLQLCFDNIILKFYTLQSIAKYGKHMSL